MEGQDGDGPSWRPLPRILYGFAIFPFLPIEDETQANAHQVPLEIGSELYIFEVFRPTTSTPYSDQESLWYRGYVVASRQGSPASIAAAAVSATTTNDSTEGGVAGTNAIVAEEPSVTVGIFPATHCLIKERLEDSDERLEEVRQAAGAAFGDKAGVAQSKRTKEPLATLVEEDEGPEEDPSSGLAGPLQTPSRARNRASVIDGRLSGYGTAAGHKRSNSSVSIAEIIQPLHVEIDDRPSPPLPSLKTGDETAAGLDEPLIDEIACSLRGSANLLYTYLYKREYARFNAVKAHIDDLHLGRRQLLSGTLSTDELQRLRRNLVDKLVQSNIQQGDDIIVRHPHWGALADVTAHGDIDERAWMSGVRMYKLGVELAYTHPETGKRPLGSHSVLGPSTHFPKPHEKHQTSGYNSDASSSSLPLPSFYHILVDLKAFFASPCAPGETAELNFSLYNKSEKRFLSEECCVIVNHQGVPRDGRFDRARTLFRDLSQQDVIDTLVLVCRIVVNGSLKTASSLNNRASTATLNSPYTFAPPQSSASFMSPALQSTASFAEQQAVSNSGREYMLMYPNDSRRSIRRPFGCAVVEISQLCKVGQSAGSYSELTMPIFVPATEANFSTLHEDILASRIKDFDKSNKAEHISIGLRFFNEDIKTLARDHPSMMQDTSLTSRLGFPDIIMPEDQRNDVYIKLWNGEFPSLQAGTTKIGRVSPVNVEVEVEVRSKAGTVLAGSISRGSGEPHVDRFTSTVFRYNATPTWGELLKLDMSPERMKECHLFFTFRNRKERQSQNTSGASLDKPFAFGFLPLFILDETFLADGLHPIALYRYEPQWNISSTYLELATSNEDNIGVHQQVAAGKGLSPLRDTFTVRSFLCSTEVTQDSTLLNILDWETKLPDSAEAFKAEFNRLKYCSEFERIKMIRHLFDSIFAILASSRNENGDIDATAFSALVNLLSLVNDRRYENFRPVLDRYIAQHFHSSSAFSHLIRSLHRLVENFSAPESAQELRAAIKVWQYLFKLIVRSRELQRVKEEDMNVTANHIESTFKKDLKALLSSIAQMMSATSPPSIVGTQGLAVQHFASIVPELLSCFPSEEIADFVITFCDAIVLEKGAIVAHKLLLQSQLINGALFLSAGARAMLVPNICRWIKPHLGTSDNHQSFGPKDTDVDRQNAKVHWFEGVRLAVATVATLIDKLHERIVDPSIMSNRHLLAQEQDSIEFVMSLLPRLLDSYRDAGSSETRQFLLKRRSSAIALSREPTIFPSVHPAPLLLEEPATSHLTARNTKSFIPLIGETAAVIVVLIHIAPSTVLSNYLQACLEVEGYQNFSRFLSYLFQACRSILKQEAFPSKWLSITMLSHVSIVRIAEPASTTMKRHLIPDKEAVNEFDTSIWKDFFQMMLALLSSPSLVIEEFTPARQRAVWRLAGDIRGSGSKVLLNAWEALSWPENSETGALPRVGGYQVTLPNMVEPVLELCLSHHDELRSTAVQILYSLVISEFHLNDSFSAIENEVLDRLDKLFSQRKGDEISRSFFITQLRSLFQSTDMDGRLREQVEAFLESVNHFLELLLGIRNLPESEEWQDDRVIGTLRLMAFIEKRHRAIFVRYVHRLVDFHVASNQFTEAGLTLKLHADLYNFDPTTVVPAIVELTFPEQSEFNRKELLYLRMLELLSRGQAYETAIAISKELQEQYESQVFAYQRLSELLTHQADLFASIVNRHRYFAPNFRVGFYGRGFPASVQNKQYVYRAYDWEKYGSFCERMQAKHPQARLLRGHTVPTIDMQNSDERYLLITAVTPEPDKSNPILQNPDVLPAIRSYFENNETRVFYYTRPLDRVERTLAESASALSNWSEKTYLYCAEAFPTILRRTEVIETQVFEISPLETALEDVNKKTSELNNLQRRYKTLELESVQRKKGEAPDTTPLSMTLNSAVDTGLAGWIPLYRRAFFDPAYVAANSDKIDMIDDLRQAIDEQVKAKCLLIHEKLRPVDMASFHSTLVKFFERNFASEIARMGEALEYKLPDLSSPVLTDITQPMNGHQDLSPSFASGHRRNLSNSTITSSSAPLPLALPPLNGLSGHTSSGHSNSGIITSDPSPSSHSRSTFSSGVPKPHPNGVHFAPTPSISQGRTSPVPSTVPSTTGNATNASERPMSLLSRISSLRKKRF